MQYEIKGEFTLAENLMTFLTFVALLAAIGLVRGDMENELDWCGVENISAYSWRLHAPALLLLVLPRKSNMLPDLSASGWEGVGDVSISDFFHIHIMLPKPAFYKKSSY